MLRGLVIAPLVAVALPAAASAAGSSVGATPSRARVALRLPGIFIVAHQAVAVPGRRVRIEGTVRPYVAGQWVTVRAYLGRRVIRRDRLRIRRSANGRYGRFLEAVKASAPGTVSVRAVHARTRELRGFKVSRTYAVLDERVGPGSIGRFVELVQQRLGALHFYIPRTGVFDYGTELAIDAYHRLLGWGTYKTLDGRTISFLLDGFGQFRVRFPHHGRHAEGDLHKQLLALIDGTNVELTFPISSGKASTPTVRGDFHVYRRVPGFLPDGMYYSSFFTGGYAIHGYDPAPDYPASHGCMRLPIADAIPAFRWLAYGDWVDVYG
jgi:hypothetical protein